jgi:hydroxymethylglutaryl-CoA lyase
MPEVMLTDVVLRDGLQDEPVVVAPHHRARIAESLLAAGLPELEVVSFVNPARVPQMAGAAEVVAGLDPVHVGAGRVSGLALNGRGVRNAAAAGLRRVRVAVSASTAHSRANAGREAGVLLEDLRRAIAEQRSVEVEAGISTAFVCPFEGQVPAQRVVELAAAFAAMGIRVISLADTIGEASTEQVLATVEAVRAAVPGIELNLHLHDGKGQAVGTVLAALDMGIRRFDTALGGYGGCPFAPGAHGNLATEVIVTELERRGARTGVNPEALTAALDDLRSVLATASPVPTA